MYKCECIYSVMSQDFDNRFATAFYLCLGFLVIISHPTVLFCFSIFFQVLDRGPINLEEVGRLKKIYICMSRVAFFKNIIPTFWHIPFVFPLCIWLGIDHFRLSYDIDL